MKIKYTKELLESMNFFSRITGAAIHDCFEMDEILHFVVEPGNIGKAIGRGGSVVHDLQQRLKKKIKVIEYDAKIENFVKNALYPLHVDGIEVVNGVVVLHSNDRSVKGLIIGRNAKNLNTLRLVVQRYFPVEDVKVE